MVENMNDGKTFQYFKQVYEMFNNTHDFVMKVDDDCYIYIDNLNERIKSFPLIGTYYGTRARHGRGGFFMIGMGYLVSKDIVLHVGKHVAKHGILKEFKGPEDIKFGMFIDKEIKIVKNRISNKTEVYGLSNQKNPRFWNHAYNEGTILLHSLKNDTLFLEAHNNFKNITLI